MRNRNTPPTPVLVGKVAKELRDAIERVRDIAGDQLGSIHIEVTYFSGAGQIEHFGDMDFRHG